MKCWHDGNITCLEDCELIENCPDRARMLEVIAEAEKEKAETISHSENFILMECIHLMHEMVTDFEDWYKFVHGVNAIEELDEDERFCVRKTYFSIVKQLFLWHTSHSGGTSTRQKCCELGVKDWSEDIEFGFGIEEDEDDDI